MVNDQKKPEMADALMRDHKFDVGKKISPMPASCRTFFNEEPYPYGSEKKKPEKTPMSKGVSEVSKRANQ